MTSVEPGFDNLDRAGRAAARLFVSPKGVIYAALALALAVSWAILIGFAARSAETPGIGTPGAHLFEYLPDLPLPLALERLLDLCLGPVGLQVSAAQAFPAFSLMWFLMSVAMMLPSAVPMIRTYCELADTAGRQKHAAVHPLVLVGGYLTVWLAASLVLAAITVAIQKIGTGSSERAAYPAAAAALAVAGLYQFSRLKQACLEKCRNPFGVLFSRWTTMPSGIFRLGVEQGLFCLGCCWALMLVMFAVGLMNVFWMALLGVFALAEKQLNGAVISRVAGVILLVWGAALLLLSL